MLIVKEIATSNSIGNTLETRVNAISATKKGKRKDMS